jgi:hypothetical protein
MLRRVDPMTDFFISYTSADEAWAEWIAWTLEAEGFTTTLQKWDFPPGSNFVLRMQRAAADCQRTIAVLSPSYMQSAFGAPEWAASFANDPQGLKGKLVPVRVAACQPHGLLKATVYIDIVGLDEEDAHQALLSGLKQGRAKPSSKPVFPGEQSASPAFPGPSATATPAQRSPNRHMPRLRSAPSDLDKRRFLKDAFETIRSGFEERLGELRRDSSGVDFDLTVVDATKFTAEIFMNGQSRARCKIWQGGLLSEGISFAEGSTTMNDNACNEMLSLAKDDELALQAVMNTGLGRAHEGLDVNHLSPERAAEYLWRRFLWRLET